MDSVRQCLMPLSCLMQLLLHAIMIPRCLPPHELQEAQDCLQQLAAAASLSGDLAAQLEGQLLAAALADGKVKEGAKLPLLPAVLPPPAPPARASSGTQTAAQQAPAPAKQGLAAGFLGSAAKPAAAAAKAGPAAEAAADSAAAAAGPASPAPSGGSPAAPAASAQRAASPQQAAAGASARAAGQARPSRPTRPGSAGGARPAQQPAVPIDPLHQLVARTDANQGVGLAVQMVNTGQCKEAIALLDLLLQVSSCIKKHCVSRNIAVVFLLR